MFNAKLIAIIFGITFITVGLLGFIDNPIASSVGFFKVNWAHNLVHLVTGIMFFIGVVKFPGQENLVVLYSGYFYGLVAVLGFVWPGDMLLGFIYIINEANRWLPLGLAVGIIAAGFLATPQLPHIKAQYN